MLKGRSDEQSDVIFRAPSSGLHGWPRGEEIKSGARCTWGGRDGLLNGARDSLPARNRNASREGQTQQDLTLLEHALFTACAIIGFDALAYTVKVWPGQADHVIVITFLIFLIPFGLLTAEVSPPSRRGRCLRLLSHDVLEAIGDLRPRSTGSRTRIWLGGAHWRDDRRAHRFFYHAVQDVGGDRHRSCVHLVTIFLSVMNLKNGKWMGNLGTSSRPSSWSSWPSWPRLRGPSRYAEGIAPAARTPPASPASSPSSASSSSSGSASSSRARPAKRWSTLRKTCRARSSAPARSRPACTSSSCWSCSSCSRRVSSARRRASRRQ